MAGALLGGPIGRFLIERNKLTPNPDVTNMKFGSSEEKIPVNEKRLTAAAYQVLITIGIGALVSAILEKTGLDFPASVGAMVAAAILRNIADHTDKFDLKLPELSIAMDSKRAEPFYQLRPFKDNMDPINLLEFILFHDRQGRSLCPSPRKVRG